MVYISWRDKFVVNVITEKRKKFSFLSAHEKKRGGKTVTWDRKSLPATQTTTREVFPYNESSALIMFINMAIEDIMKVS